MQNLIGKQILNAWDVKDRQGWFEGRVHGRTSPREISLVPPLPILLCDTLTLSLTVGVKKKKTAKCEVAHELTSRTSCANRWWVVIVKDH